MSTKAVKKEKIFYMKNKKLFVSCLPYPYPRICVYKTNRQRKTHSDTQTRVKKKKKNLELSVRSKLRRLLTSSKARRGTPPVPESSGGRSLFRWDNEHLALPPPATLRHTRAH